MHCEKKQNIPIFTDWFLFQFLYLLHFRDFWISIWSKKSKSDNSYEFFCKKSAKIYFKNFKSYVKNRDKLFVESIRMNSSIYHIFKLRLNYINLWKMVRIRIVIDKLMLDRSLWLWMILFHSIKIIWMKR